MSAFQISHIMKFMTASALTLALSSTLLANLSAAATPTEYLDYPKLLEEQRNWAGLSTKTVHVSNITWTYSEGGSKDKPTLLLIHGLDSNRDSWNEVARSLTKQYHVIVPDLPGSGNTKAPLNFDFSIPNLSEELRFFVETLRIQNKLNIAGHSLGGSIAMFYASQYTLDTKSLFLMGASGLFQNNHTQYTKNPIYLKQLVVSQPGDLNFVMKKAMVNQPFVPEVRLKQQEQQLIAQSGDTSKLINEVFKLNHQYTVASFRNLLKSIDAPTLILWGKQDQIVNFEVASEIKSSIRHAQQPIILNNVGHMPILEAPQRVTESYLDFLSKIQYQNNVAAKH
ncbi:alpha/beta fold hydrolase [Acinetobacter shaoyimingii]|nr:alpha/beta hydrolase [Acinetobacter shaoyimingii]